MRFYIVSFILLGCLIPTGSLARNGYFGIRGGISEERETEIIDKYASAGFMSVYIGGQSGIFRIEGEYTASSRVKYEDIDTTAQFQRLMANSYIDLHVSRYVRPYLSAGIGPAWYSAHDKTAGKKENGTNFAWNASAGIGVKLTRNLTFDTGYRYADMGDVSLNSQTLHFNTQEFYAGMRFLF